MNDLLIPKFKADFDLTQTQANLVQSAFFGAYFLVSLAYFLISAAKGDPINRIGYKNGLVLGLIVAGLGCFMFYPAAVSKSYPLFLGAMLIVGAGVTLIQIAANPYVSILGPEASAPARLNLSQGINSLGYVIAPLIGGILIFGNEIYNDQAGGVDSLKLPYVGLGVAFIALAVIFKMITLPEFTQEGEVEAGVRAFRHKHFIWGWLAIFFYVGSEVAVGSILINYLGDAGVMGLSETSAAHFLSFYWGGVMIGRLMGAISLSNIKESKKYGFMVLSAAIATAIIYANATFKEKVTNGHHINPMDIIPYVGLVVLSFVFFVLGQSKPGRMVGLFALMATLLTVFSMATHGQLALWSIVGIGLFNSIMWSNIFTLSIRGLGRDKAQGSSLLVMMIVGGAVLPLIQGILMDAKGVRISLAVVLVGYVYLVFFGFFGSKSGKLLTEEEEEKAITAGH
ncbi:sugar MFS transporter [Luteolibacter pohnpeiensis]|uniref:Sugar MFS transporter n=1 Tax=Luteolibacter pohnpeiensis TaxID=454153 RepID=A0A934S058_9BACT|nr:sugar MFS transporter [Luteolibacter pohnpeiensis]MBK1880825.1 sugar MFS transporter [Luteolibacter pohnpeiensis]